MADLWIFHARRWKISNFLDILEQSINHIPEPILTMIFMIIIHVTALQLTNSAIFMIPLSGFTQYEQCLHCIWTSFQKIHHHLSNAQPNIVHYAPMLRCEPWCLNHQASSRFPTQTYKQCFNVLWSCTSF